jgi:hypothetical protein
MRRAPPEKTKRKTFSELEVQEMEIRGKKRHRLTQRDDVFRSIADFKRQAKEEISLSGDAGRAKQLSL